MTFGSYRGEFRYRDAGAVYVIRWVGLVLLLAFAL